MTFNKLPSDLIEAETITLFETAATSGSPWSATAHAEAKSKLKATLLTAQNGRCAYCRRLIKDETGHLEIDHILPKGPHGPTDRRKSNVRIDRKSTDGYPTFTFTPKNLILTCKRCNNKKGTYDCRRLRDLDPNMQYDLTEEYYEWVHPYVHNYSDHIEIIEGMIFHAREGSTNGETLISVCELDTISVVERASANLRVQNAKTHAFAIASLLHNLDHYGWDFIIDSVQEAFPDAPIEEIKQSVEAFKAAMGSAEA